MHYINKAPVGAFVCVSNTAHTLRSSPSHTLPHTRPLVVTWWLQPTPPWRRSWGWVTHWTVGPPNTSHRRRHSLCDNSLYWSDINTWDRLTSAEQKGLYFQKGCSEVKLNLAKWRAKQHSCHRQDPKKSNPTTIIYSVMLYSGARMSSEAGGHPAEWRSQQNQQWKCAVTPVYGLQCLL